MTVLVLLLLTSFHVPSSTSCAAIGPNRSHAAYEAIYFVKALIEKSSIENTEESLASDRR